MASNREKRIRVEELLGIVEGIKKEMEEHQRAAKEALEEIQSRKSEFEEQGNKITEQLKTTREAAETIEIKMDEIEKLGTNARKLIEEINDVKSNVEESEDYINDNMGKISTLHSEYEDLREKIEALLPGATGAGLAKSFYDRKTTLEKRINYASWVFYGAIGLLFVLGFSVFKESIVASSPSEILAIFLQKSPYFLGVLLLIEFSRRQYSSALKLEEDYAFKEATSKSFDGYQKAMAKQKIGEKTLAETLGQNVLQILAERPGRLITDENVYAYEKSEYDEDKIGEIGNLIPEPWLRLFDWCRHPVLGIMIFGALLIFIGFAIGSFIKNL
ncbi:MAG: hypothetical protein ACP5EQ_07925 [Candidatus Cloacimonadia bacterium]